MRLTGFTDYARRTLIYPALQPGRLLTIANILKAWHLREPPDEGGVPPRRFGLHVTTRVHGGGMRPPDPSLVGQVVRRTVVT